MFCRFLRSVPISDSVGRPAVRTRSSSVRYLIFLLSARPAHVRFLRSFISTAASAPTKLWTTITMPIGLGHAGRY